MANIAPILIATNNNLSNMIESKAIKDKPIRVLPKNGSIIQFIESLIHNNIHNTKDPFYVLDLGVVANLMATWTNSLPNVKPFYAVKCNPDPAMLAALAAIGSGFDCASRAEIETIIALGVEPDRIIFANPCKPESHIEYAASVGVNLTTFDSVAEVEKIRKLHPKSELLIRIDPPEDSRAIRPSGSKYGAFPHEVEPLLKAARSARLAVSGVAFHLGSGCSNTRAYASAIGAAKEAFEAAARLGMTPMRILDIGGGFTVGSKFEEAASDIRAALDTHFPDRIFDVAPSAVVAEPGRFFANSAFTVAVNVIGKRVRGEGREYWVNDGIYGSFMSSVVLEGGHGERTCVGLACNSCRLNPTCIGANTYISTVFGPTCDSRDTILKDYRLPELEVNDWLVFTNMGAYSSAMKSNFNGFNTSGFLTYLACSTIDQ